jgi:uncharacterized membrane protein
MCGCKENAMAYDVHVLTSEVQRLGDPERRVLGHLLQRKPIAQDLNRAFEEQLTLGQRAADWVAAVGGSWPFLFVAVAGISLWVVLNIESDRPFDAFPFIFLNLVLSCLAALQAPIIIMSQNRQAVKDRLDAQHDYEVNLKAEMEIMALHVKLDELRERQWTELMGVQQRLVTQIERIETQMNRADRERLEPNSGQEHQ